MALCDCVNEGHYMIHLHRATVDLIDSISVYEDNVGAKCLSENPLNFRKTRHINYRYHVVRDKVASGQFDVQYVKSEFNLADIMTKVLPKDTFIKITKGIFGKDTMAPGSTIVEFVGSSQPVRFYESYEELTRWRQTSFPFG